MQHEVLMYAGAQKEGLGFDRLVEEAKMRMSRYQVSVFPCYPHVPVFCARACPAHRGHTGPTPAVSVQVTPNILIVPPQARCSRATHAPFAHHRLHTAA